VTDEPQRVQLDALKPEDAIRIISEIVGEACFPQPKKVLDVFSVALRTLQDYFKDKQK
jgi:hypothetical protein